MPENTSSNACMNRGSSFSGSRLIPAALFLPPAAKGGIKVGTAPGGLRSAHADYKAPTLRCVRRHGTSGEALARDSWQGHAAACGLRKNINRTVLGFMLRADGAAKVTSSAYPVSVFQQHRLASKGERVLLLVDAV
jgi:hypothetical protein